MSKLIRVKFKQFYMDGASNPPKTHFCANWSIAAQVMADLGRRYPEHQDGAIVEEHDTDRYHHDPGGSVFLTEPLLIRTVGSPNISVYCGDVTWAKGMVEPTTRNGASYRKVYSLHHVLVLPAEDADAYLRWLRAVETEARDAFDHFVAQRKAEREDRGIG